MEITFDEGLRTVKFDLILTLALAALSLFVGGFVQRRVRVLARASLRRRMSQVATGFPTRQATNIPKIAEAMMAEPAPWTPYFSNSPAHP